MSSHKKTGRSALQTRRLDAFRLFRFFVSVAAVEDHVHQNAYDQAGGDGADLHAAEVERQAADAAYQNGGGYKQVAASSDR